MKTISKLLSGFFFLFSITFLLKCNKNEDLLNVNTKTGGLIEVTTKSLNYFFGTSVPLVAKIKVFQGTVKTSKVEVYKQYFTKDTALTHDPTGTTEISTNLVLLKIIDILNDSTNSYQDISFTYDDLVSGLILAGNPMPETDETLAIGSKWVLSFKVISDNGTVSNRDVATVGISTRFAGTYKVKYAEYYRIGVFRPDVTWPEEYVIESVNQTTYKILDYAGPFAGNEVLFTVDGDGNIDFPTDQILNGFPIITCNANPALMTNVPCGPSTNKATANFDTGKDILVMSCCYNTTSGATGPREWYVELEKIP
ncbi:MAG: hypothetical protein IPM95_15375 [Sphingobacteriales bacterium]|nr:hypothetical protein [Sphingobacteriales bacterium]